MAAIKFKNAFYWLIGLLALLLAVLSVVLSFLDWNKYRDTLSELATTQLGMEVELAGNVSVALFPRPSVSAETVRISPLTDGYSEPVATADKISIRLGLSGILKQTFSIQSLQLEGMTAAVEQDSAGAWKLRGWVGSDTDAGATTPGVDLSRLEMVNATVALTPYGRDTRAIEKMSMRLRGSLPDGPLDWEGSFEYLGERLSTTGRLKPISTRNETSVKTALFLGGSEINISGRFSDSGDMVGRIQAEGESVAEFLPALTALAEVGVPDSLPMLPFALDLQLEKKGTLIKLESKGLSFGSTRGRADLTLVQKENGSHATGVLALGVVDLDEWVFSHMAHQAEANEPATASGLTGVLDVTIEGVQNKKGIGQRIDLALVFGPTGPSVSNFQAMLPGAATVSFDGMLSASEGTGTVAFDIGNLPDLLSWVGADLPASLPPGRLTTASGKGRLDLQTGVWAIREIEGLVDTTEVKGEISGDTSGVLPSHVKLNLSKLNLNAFGSGPDEDNQPAIPAEQDIALDIAVADLAGFDTRFNNARFVGGLLAGVLSIDHLRLERGQGSLQLEGRLENSEGGIAGQVAADFSDWDLPIASYFVQDLRRHLLSAGAGKVTGSFSGDGSVSEMRINLDATSGGNEMALNGRLGIAGDGLSLAALQGGIKHKNMAGLLRSLHVGNYRKLPAQLTFLLEKQSAGSSLQARISGDLAGGKLQSDLETETSGFEARLTFTHENIPQLERSLGTELTVLDKRESVSASLTFREDEAGRQLQIDEVRSGRRTISGAATVDNNNNVAGAFSLGGLELLNSSKAGPSAGFADFLPYLDMLNGYSGRLSLDVKDVAVSGQRLTAPAGFVEFTGQTAGLSLGQGATINGSPVTAEFSVGLNGRYPLEAVIKAGKVSFAPLLAAQGLGEVMSMDGAGDLTLKGEFGHSKGFLSSLEGDGTFTANAGRLAFLDVAGLQRSMSQATSGRTFLQTVGNLLRAGNTPVSEFAGKFSLVGGVLLVEEAKANGTWGHLALDGQVNIVSRLLNIKGKLALNTPKDVPEIPVSYNGTFDAPNTQWSSRLFERFVIAGIERRLRAGLFQEQEARERETGSASENTGTAVLSRALGLLEALRAQQEKQKKEAKEKAAQQASNAPAS